MSGCAGRPALEKENLLIKRLVLAAAVATALGSAMGAASAEPSACLTTTVTVNGTDLPTTGTNCVPPAAK